MISWEKVVLVKGPGGAYVIRACPDGVSPVMSPATGAIAYFALAKLLQRFRRSQPWIVTLHRADDDPSGPAVLSEACPSRASAMEVVKKFKAQLRSEVFGAPS